MGSMSKGGRFPSFLRKQESGAFALVIVAFLDSRSGAGMTVGSPLPTVGAGLFTGLLGGGNGR